MQTPADPTTEKSQMRSSSIPNFWHIYRSITRDVRTTSHGTFFTFRLPNFRSEQRHSEDKEKVTGSSMMSIYPERNPGDSPKRAGQGNIHIASCAPRFSVQTVETERRCARMSGTPPPWPTGPGSPHDNKVDFLSSECIIVIMLGRLGS